MRGWAAAASKAPNRRPRDWVVPRTRNPRATKLPATARTCFGTRPCLKYAVATLPTSNRRAARTHHHRAPTTNRRNWSAYPPRGSRAKSAPLKIPRRTRMRAVIVKKMETSPEMTVVRMPDPRVHVPHAREGEGHEDEVEAREDEDEGGGHVRAPEVDRPEEEEHEAQGDHELPADLRVLHLPPDLEVQGLELGRRAHVEGGDGVALDPRAEDGAEGLVPRAVRHEERPVRA